MDAAEREDVGVDERRLRREVGKGTTFVIEFPRTKAPSIALVAG